ncbi:hypothetical protein TREMEDRAFT_64860 [Tremella mesenterica DSM 1558]|uniref:uncharacterized protein n=1 Tax=Tremella mesenterica (strain ATCC 24925 / CBS 8224 / DSM 1558 / NBRC 9311 / NRRL Y-6157 / RJB 2259-6 / UBC 559-6) TaxID=578456 RepID=UPI0003F4A31F|nr:uncharacterized protein TREMEDRAFT_64860 [Tremella mesenterica DSM 1558]EIW66994.1 hypothetical protein TREMEDRAFT_64860 [Tremella mesenterica DSM 1558]
MLYWAVNVSQRQGTPWGTMAYYAVVIHLVVNNKRKIRFTPRSTTDVHSRTTFRPPENMRAIATSASSYTTKGGRLRPAEYQKRKIFVSTVVTKDIWYSNVQLLHLTVNLLDIKLACNPIGISLNPKSTNRGNLGLEGNEKQVSVSLGSTFPSIENFYITQ